MGEHPIGSELVIALEGTWEAIRARHSAVPAAVLITGAGSGGQRREVRMGQFAASRWRLGEERALGEIFVGGEGLSRGARMVLGTLLHEAAHALAYQRGIKDNSRQGRYHNARYRQLAEELGLEVEHDPQLGWSLTTLADDTARRYARAIDRLERALVAYREGEHAASASTSPNGAVACVCGCGRRIRAANGVLAQGPIVCGLCSTSFQPQATTTNRQAA